MTVSESPVYHVGCRKNSSQIFLKMKKEAVEEMCLMLNMMNRTAQPLSLLRIQMVNSIPYNTSYNLAGRKVHTGINISVCLLSVCYASICCVSICTSVCPSVACPSVCLQPLVRLRTTFKSLITASVKSKENLFVLNSLTYSNSWSKCNC